MPLKISKAARKSLIEWARCYQWWLTMRVEFKTKRGQKK